MLVLAASLLALLSPLAAGRLPRALVAHRWRLPGLVWVALLLQTAVLELPTPAGVAPVVHVGTYVVAAAFLVLNRSLRGTLVAAAGTVSNGLTIALNGGTLPASPAAVAAAGIDPDMAFANSAVVAHPVLPWLGDALAWPAPLPLANTFSVGDVLLVVGVALAAWSRPAAVATTPDDDAGAADGAADGPAPVPAAATGGAPAAG